VKKSPNKLQQQRNGLLAIVHIAKKDLGIDDDLYRDILGQWGVRSSAALSIPELEELVNHFSRCGFRVIGRGHGAKGIGKKKPSQADALRERIRQEAADMKNGDLRLAGIVKSKAGVEKLEWIRDVGKLKQILKCLAVFKQRDEEIYD